MATDEPSSSLGRPRESDVLSSPGMLGDGLLPIASRLAGPALRAGVPRLRGTVDPPRVPSKSSFFRAHRCSLVDAVPGRLSRSNLLVPLHRRLSRPGSRTASDDPDSPSLGL